MVYRANFNVDRYPSERLGKFKTVTGYVELFVIHF